MIVNRISRPIPALTERPEPAGGQFEQVLEKSTRNRVTKPIPARPEPVPIPLSAKDLMTVSWPVDPPQREPILTNRAAPEGPPPGPEFIAYPAVHRIVVDRIALARPDQSDSNSEASTEAPNAPIDRRDQAAVGPEFDNTPPTSAPAGPDNWTLARAEATQSPVGRTSVEIKPAVGLDPKPVERLAEKITEKTAAKRKHVDSGRTERRTRGVSRSQIERLITKTAAKHDLSPELLRAVIEAESGFNHRAKSPVGAMGLMQLMPETANFLGVNDPYDPVQNLEAGGRYLKGLIDRYEGSVHRALAAYNWGPGNLDRRGYRNIPGQTRHFIRRVMDNAGGFSKIASKRRPA